MNAQLNTTQPRGLADLAGIELDAVRQKMLDRARRCCFGPPPIRARKLAEAHDLLALTMVAPRLHVFELDLTDSLRAALHLTCPVPCRPDPVGPLVVENDALLGLRYQHESFRKPTPGWGFLQILAPRKCWHANISTDGAQALCLGTSIPAGVRLRDLVIMAFGALSMQTVQIDQHDSAGVLNHGAAVWWQANLSRIPLCHEAFIRDEDLIGSNA